jgi:hypothetical protein
MALARTNAIVRFCIGPVKVRAALGKPTQSAQHGLQHNRPLNLGYEMDRAMSAGWADQDDAETLVHFLF